MMVLSMSTVPISLRGYLSIYLWEIDTNVYVGNVSTKVRDLLWKRVEECVEGRGRAVMIYPSATEQGFEFKACGMSYKFINFDGLNLILHPTEETLLASYVPKVIKKIPKQLHYKKYILLDLESTGLKVEEDRIIEIGAIKVISGQIRDTFDTLIDQNIKIPEKITALTGITQDMLDSGISFPKAVLQLKDFVNGMMVIGYNIANYDIRLLHYECQRHRTEFPFTKTLDLLPIVRNSIPNEPSYSLRDIAKKLGIECENTHRALSDCVTCNKIYEKLLIASRDD